MNKVQTSLNCELQADVMLVRVLLDNEPLD